MDTQQTFAEIDSVLTNMIKTLSLFTEEEINTIPFEGSWTPGQVAQHIILSDSGFASLLTGPVKDTDRQPDQHVDQLKAIFLNFDIKMKSPDFILPPAIDYKKEELLANLEQIRTKLNQFDQTREYDQNLHRYGIARSGLFNTCGSNNVYYCPHQTPCTSIRKHIHKAINYLK